VSLTAPASSVPRASSRVFFPEGPLDLTVICGRMSCCVFGSSLLISSPSQASPAFLLACSCLCLARLLSAGSGSRWIYIERGPVAGVEVAVERGWFIDLSEEGVLGEEPPELGIEVAGLCVVEAGLGVEDVAGEGEAVGGLGELSGESEVAPGVLGPDSETQTATSHQTFHRSRRRRLQGRRVPSSFQGAPAHGGATDGRILLPAPVGWGPFYFGSLRNSIG